MDYFSGLYQAGRRFREKSRQNATQTAGRQERRSPEPGCQVVSPVQNALTVFFYLYTRFVVRRYAVEQVWSLTQFFSVSFS